MLKRAGAGSKGSEEHIQSVAVGSLRHQFEVMGQGKPRDRAGHLDSAG
jgi:hypothetical protein